MYSHILVASSLVVASMGVVLDGAKRIVVTGANKGIGRAIVEELVRDYDDTYVYLGSRDAGRGEKAVKEITEKIPSSADRLEALELDVSDAESVSAAAKAVGAPVYAVMNNAGIGFGRSFEETLATNLYGTMHVCEAFLPMLEPKVGRIVNMGSGSAPNFVQRCGNDQHKAMLTDPTGLSVEDVKAIAKSYEGMTDYENVAYGLSKACLNAYTFVLARDNPDFFINSCTPGYILTDLTRGMGASKLPEEGTKAPMYLIMDKEVESLPTGRFYGSDAKRSPFHRYREPGSPPYDGKP